ncbi:hypothetical protein P43SY_003230 [Pythium insidiosum]|uniref:Uncharacterized protein n=1 Tax=Pythium insidiosum TaxID=114742 RepID=A0AAD5M656_PYTIN|nr:hypothetical protein P43SY_003230 [Pythium insidiosum]
MNDRAERSAGSATTGQRSANQELDSPDAASLDARACVSRPSSSSSRERAGASASPGFRTVPEPATTTTATRPDSARAAFVVLRKCDDVDIRTSGFQRIDEAARLRSRRRCHRPESGSDPSCPE